MHTPPVCPERVGEGLQCLRVCAYGRSHRSDHGRVFIQQQPHRDCIDAVDVAPGALVELSGEPMDALQVNSVQMLRGIGHRRLAVQTRVTEDASQLREPSRGIVHRA